MGWHERTRVRCRVVTARVRAATARGRMALAPDLVLLARRLVLSARRGVVPAALVGAIAVVLAGATAVRAGDPWRAVWIWDTPGANAEPQPAGTRCFRRSFELDAGVNQAHTLALVDNDFRLFVNGQDVATGGGWTPPTELDIAGQLHPGRNVIAIEASNSDGPAGLFFESNLKTRRGQLVHVVTDGEWRCAPAPVDGWTMPGFDDEGWAKVSVLGGMGIGPWGNQGKPGGTGKPPPSEVPLPPEASMELFVARAGFEVELVAAEPDLINPVVMAFDEQGRIYVAESHTYRWEAEKSPIVPPRNPVALLERGDDGRYHRKAIVAQGFTDPIMGIEVRDGRIWLSALNKVLVGDLRPDGTAGELTTIVRDNAVPWNPFGMFQLSFGPDDLLYLIVGNHPIEMIGADGTTLKTRGNTGAFFRMKPDGTGLEMLAQGMRAPFSFDFDAWGHDWVLSNGEGNPNRLLMNLATVDYHFQTRHGDWAWLAGEHPWSPPVTEMERGANTQVVCYLDGAYPETYWGSLFVANWGAHGFASVNHKIDLYRPDDRGGIEDVSVFLDSSDPMFRPTQLIAGHDGCLYMLDWYGRDDENDLTGRLYRIAYRGDDAKRPMVKQPFDAGARLSAAEAKALLDLQSNSAWEREQAARLLAARRNPAAVAAMRQILGGDRDPFISSRMLWVLRRMGTPQAVDAIADTLRTKHPLVRAMCVRLLRELLMAGSPEELQRRLAVVADDPDPETRVEMALSATDPAKVIAGLGEALKLGAIRDRRLRYQCAAELSRRWSAEPLAGAVRSPDELVALTGWIALDVGLLERVNPAVPEALSMLLQDPPAWRLGELLAIADRWATGANVAALQAFLTRDDLSMDQLASALGILRRFGPEAVEGLSGEALSRMFTAVEAGRMQILDNRDKYSALRMAATMDVGPAGGGYIRRCLHDGGSDVRLAALEAVRVGGWRYPALFAEVEAMLGPGEAAPSGKPPAIEERIAAVAAMSGQDPPATALWRKLLTHRNPRLLREAIRTSKQFAGFEPMRDLLLEVTPELVRRDAGLTGELAAALDLYDVDPASVPALANVERTERMDRERLAGLMVARLPSADARLGADVYQRMGCVACHDVAGERKLFGPALKDIGKAATAQYIAESILLPGRVIKDGFESEHVRLRDGGTVTGLVERHDDMMHILQGTLKIEVPASDVVERVKSDMSPMPEFMLMGTSLDELADLLAYLVSQGGDPKAAQAAAGG